MSNMCYLVFFLSGFLSLICSAAFQRSANNHAENERVARTFVSRSSSFIRPHIHPNVISQSTSFSFKLFSSVASIPSLEEEIPPNLVWLNDHFNFSEEQADKLLNKTIVGLPNLLTMDQSVLTSRVNWLQKRLKLKDEEFGSIVRRFPRILIYRHDTNLGPTLDYLQERLALDTKALSSVIQKNPSIMGYSVTQKLKPKLDWIQNRLYLNETKALQKFVSIAPQMLTLSIDDNLEPTFKWIQERLNLTEPQIAKLCVRAPQILTFNVDGNIKPTLDWLVQRLDLDQVELGKVVRKAPTILNLRVDSLEQKLCWLQQRLCLDDASLKKVIISLPAIVYLSASTVEPKLQWLKEQLFLPELGDVGELVGRYPQLLGISIETNLEPTLDFFKECIGVDAAVELVVKSPVVLGVSLGKRLRPRLEQAQQIGIEIDAGCLRRMAKLTEEKWLKSLDYQSKKLAKSKAEEQLW